MKAQRWKLARRVGSLAVVLATLGLVSGCEEPTAARAVADVVDTTSSLVAQYTFENSLSDVSGNSHTATAAGTGGAPTYVSDGKHGAAVHLDNTAVGVQYLTLPDGLVGKAFTVSLWMRTTAFTGWGGLFHLQMNSADGATEQGWLSIYSGDARFRDDVNSAWNDATGSSPSLNAWHMYTATMTSGGLGSFYIDGALVTTVQTEWNTFGGTTSVFQVGQDPWGVQAGDYDSLSLWNRALSAAEVSAVYAEN